MSSLLEISSMRFLIYDTFSHLFLYNYYEEDYTQLMKKLEKIKDIQEINSVVNFKTIWEKLSDSKRSDYLIEYTTLFLTGLGVKPLTPVESKRFFSLMGERVAKFRKDDIMRFYSSRRLKLNYMNQFVFEEDHISNILAFMAYLIKEEIALRQERRDVYKNLMDQKNFFITHIQGWIPDWINDVINDPRSDIFKIVCRELKKWIDFENSYLLGGGKN
ncbi:dehydrogenase [Sulfolobus sp. S-194]|uniref:TorD/DmsD family molecular chaperone n=1 Tax=Sulfolobus sp. S-194 TaxID=2512240 RepID=UPI001437146F|nr:molecular chaperone TorD family protein [Sulfolobus sp. S-194]QIW24750.1 dehydrogenase [Sulfolobus sp. S-194]